MFISFFQYLRNNLRDRSSFTLIELLVVIAIIAILAVIVVLVLNPAELLRQGRDASRVADLAQLNQTLNLFQTDGGTSFGAASTTYVSIPDPAATSTTLGNACTGLGLPSLPSGWSYHCSASSTYRNTNGTGWVPVNFGSISFGSPLGVLPIDPVNTTSSGLYYTYTSGGSWEMTALMESANYAPRMNMDGGTDPALYEQGSNLGLVSGIRGLVGYWKFDEGSGTSAGDSSGYNNTGTLLPSTSTPIWSTGKTGDALSFNGADYVQLTSTPTTGTGPFAIFAWIKTSNTGARKQIISYGSDTYSNGEWFFVDSSDGIENDLSSLAGPFSTATVTDNNWHFVGVVNNAGIFQIYIDGVASGDSKSMSPVIGTGNTPYIGTGMGTNFNIWRFNGLIDDVRIYSRALSAAEISAIYNATK